MKVLMCGFLLYDLQTALSVDLRDGGLSSCREQANHNSKLFFRFFVI